MRARLLGAPKVFREKRFAIDLGDGQPPLEVVVRQPSVEERDVITNAAADINVETKTTKVSVAKLRIEAVLALTRDAESGERAFEEADRESILNMPAGGWFDDVANAAMEMLNVDVAEAKKKSPETSGSADDSKSP